MTWDYFSHQKNSQEKPGLHRSQTLKTTLAVQIRLGEMEKETLVYLSHGANTVLIPKPKTLQETHSPLQILLITNTDPKSSTNHSKLNAAAAG